MSFEIYLIIVCFYFFFSTFAEHMKQQNEFNTFPLDSKDKGSSDLLSIAVRNSLGDWDS